MAERPSDIQNWQKRQFISFGPHFRIDSGNPQMGLNGEMVYNLFAETDSGDSNIMGLQNGGNFQIFNDKSIEIYGNQEGKGGVGINLCTFNGGQIALTAKGGGEVLIKGRKIVLEAEDIEIRSSNTLQLGEPGCSSVDIYGTRIHGHGVTGNYFVRQLSAGSLVQRAFANSHCQGDLPT